ncbi:MAG TPA: hypothetical protein VNW46_13090 [Gemmatimonadaceae bacterium]|jgi:hypothetical protein|nr:hypothetical protein [Gemmatimonadaceae bacterium]
MQKVPIHQLVGLRVITVPSDVPPDVEFVYLLPERNGYRVVLATPDGEQMLRDEFKALVNDPDARAAMRDVRTGDT